MLGPPHWSDNRQNRSLGLAGVAAAGGGGPSAPAPFAGIAQLAPLARCAGLLQLMDFADPTLNPFDDDSKIKGRPKLAVAGGAACMEPTLP